MCIRDSFSCIGITFLAYAGFGMMANAADKVKDPQVIMPRAFLVAIGVTTLLYICLLYTSCECL